MNQSFFIFYLYIDMDQKHNKCGILKKITADDNKNRYLIFYSEWCGYSMNAIKFLRDNNLNYKSYIIDKIDGGMEKLLSCLLIHANKLNFDPNHKTRPIIFKDGKFIGGYDQLKLI